MNIRSGLLLHLKRAFETGWCRLGLLALVLLLPGTVLGAPQGKSFHQEIIQGNKLDVWKKDQKVEHSDAVVGMLLLLGEEAFKKGDQQSAIAYGEKAAKFSPESPLPHFFLSHVTRGLNPVMIAQTVREYMMAIRLSLNDFWFLSASLGALGMTLLMAMILSALTFLLYAYLLYFPQWIHYLQERLPGGHRIRSYTLGGILGLLLLVLFRVLPPFWFLLMNLLLFWFFYKREEKQVAVLFVVGLTSLSLLLGPFLLLMTGKRFSIMDQMVKNQQAEFLGIYPQPSVLIAETPDWRVLFAEASHRVQEKNWGAAETLYRQALLHNPHSAPILNNLGNVFFYQNHLGKALEYYQRAIGADPENVTAQYNLSQVYKESLLFSKGEEQYHQVKAMAPEQVNAYSQATATYPDYPVIEERFTQKEIWQTLGQILFESDVEREAVEHLWIGDSLSWTQFAVIALFVGMGLVSLCIYLSPSLSGSFCSICFKVTCARCQKTFSKYNMCADCGKNLKTAVGKKRGTFPKRVYPFLLFPGGGQLMLHQPLSALFFMVSFYFFATLVLFGDLFFSSAPGRLSVETSPLFFIVMILLGLVSTYHFVSKRKDFVWH